MLVSKAYDDYEVIVTGLVSVNNTPVIKTVAIVKIRNRQMLRIHNARFPIACSWLIVYDFGQWIAAKMSGRRSTMTGYGVCSITSEYLVY